jgi:5'/3'-nucleotidase SurE
MARLLRIYGECGYDLPIRPDHAPMMEGDGPGQSSGYGVVGKVLAEGFPAEVDVINVNIPSRIQGGYEVTRLSRKLFHTGVEKRLDPRGRPYFWINGPLIDDAEEGTDVHAIRKATSLSPQ